MSGLITKDALKPSRYHLRDGRIFDVLPEDMPHYANRLRDMTAAGLHVPVTWEHQPSVKPGAALAAEQVKLTLGHIKDAALDGGVLEVKFDAPSEDDRKRLPAIKYVSPYIEWDYQDPSGRVWPGPSITHIAVTNNPVQADQKPFQMSNNPLDLWSQGVALSLEDEPDEETRHEEDLPLPAEEEEEDIEVIEGDASKIGKVVTYLGHMGMMLPPDTTPENFLDRLYTAVLTKLAADDPSSAGQDQMETPGMSSTAKEANPPIVMSQADQEKMASREKRIIDMERAGLRSRVDLLLAKGRITPAIKQKLDEALSAVALSLADDGTLAPNDFVIRLEAYEELPENTVFPGAKEVPLSRSGLAVDQEEARKRRQEIIDTAAPQRNKE